MDKMSGIQFLTDIKGMTIEDAFKDKGENYIAIKFTNNKYLRLKVEHGEIVHEWF
jgi:hypothetical protein